MRQMSQKYQLLKNRMMSKVAKMPIKKQIRKVLDLKQGRTLQQVYQLNPCFNDIQISKQNIWTIGRFSTGDQQNKQYHEKKVAECMKIIQYIYVFRINLGGNRRSAILKDICDVSFPYLRTLSLRNNKIVNIQTLQLISLPLLARLQIQNNYISSITSLKKLNLTQIFAIDLSGNLISSDLNFQQIKAPSLGQIWLQTYDQQKVINPSFEWVAKLESRIVQRIVIKNQIRIRNKKLDEKLRHKYFPLDISRKFIQYF